MNISISQISIFSILFFTLSISAHPAKRVEAVKKDNVIKIHIFHKVGRRKHHFLEHIIITHNGQIIDERRVTKSTGQSTKEAHEIILPATSLHAGDQITVWSHCNEGGDHEATVIIKENMS